MEIIRIVQPPYSEEFLSEMLKTLTKPSVRELFFPDKANPEAHYTYKQPLEVLIKFCSQINDAPGAEVKNPDEEQKYKLLCSDARDALCRIKGHAQRSIVSYF